MAGFHKNIFGFDHSEITELQERIQRVEGLSKGFTKLSGTVTGLTEKGIEQSDKVKELAEITTDLTEEVTKLSETVTDLTEKGIEQLEIVKELAEKLIGVPEKVTKLSETVTNLTEKGIGQSKELVEIVEATVESEKIMAMCIIASAVSVTAITCLVVFFIYQGVKCEMEEKRNSSFTDQDIPSGNFDIKATDNTGFYEQSMY